MKLSPVDGIFRLTTDNVLTILERLLIIDSWNVPTVPPSDLQFNRLAEKIQSDDPDLTSRQTDSDLFEWFNDKIFAQEQSEDLFQIGFRWDEEDYSSPVWWPQGVTGTADAAESGEVGSEKLLVVSWHYDTKDGKFEDHPLEEEGARISIVKMTNWSDQIVYRHVLLVEPTADDSDSFTHLEGLHAGGIVWFDRWLYVANGGALLLFDMNNIRDLAQQQVNFRATGHGSAPVASMLSGIPDHDSRTDGLGLEIGWVDGRYEAYGYRYICPLIAKYTIDPESADSLSGHFSSIGLDRSVDPPRLISAKFIDKDEPDATHDKDINNSLLCYWELDPQTGLLRVSSSGHIEALEAFQTNLRSIQGVTAKGATVWLSASNGTLAHLYVRHTDGSAGDEKHFWAKGCESLTWSPHSDHLWSITEFESQRIGFAVKLSDLGG